MEREIGKQLQITVPPALAELNVPDEVRDRIIGMCADRKMWDPNTNAIKTLIVDGTLYLLAMVDQKPYVYEARPISEVEQERYKKEFTDKNGAFSPLEWLLHHISHMTTSFVYSGKFVMLRNGEGFAFAPLQCDHCDLNVHCLIVLARRDRITMVNIAIEARQIYPAPAG